MTPSQVVGASDAGTVAWASRLDAMAAQWQALGLRRASPWVRAKADRRMAAMLHEQQGHARTGRWLGGPTSLLQVLGLQWDEGALVRCLEWLVRPDGRHALGDHLLRRLASSAGASPEADLGRVRTALEESRPTEDPADGEATGTRADLVVYTRDITLVIEAKVYAPEQPGQLDRLRRTWAPDPGAHFLFLTRHGTIQTSSKAAAWRALTWSDIADVLESAPRLTPEVHVLAQAFRRV